ncbi:MAG: trypsin-like peptidase domain-containing protein [Clostridia bacterium]|nr:trypsin-like peptidase domain-containing protein [Clostridia bacterium]
MEEFNSFDYNEEQNKPQEEAEQNVSEESEAFEEPPIEEAKPEPEIPEQPFIPPYNPINYTPVKPVEDKQPMSRGLKFFALVMAVVIALTTACTAGYFLGKSSTGNGFIGSDIKVGLEAKPEKSNEMTAAQVYEKVNPGVVGICVYNSKGIGANASGVIYSKDGYIITNDHIYSEVAAAKFKIYTHDNKEYDAEYVAGDKVSDLAVLKVKGAKLEAATFGNSEQLIFGENVVAVGRPGGAENASSITKGIISATSRRVQTTSNYSSRLIETDCPINPGSSGGALVNMYGQVIGITSSKLASEEIDAVGYAIPTTTVKRIARELIKHGKVLSRAKLGITYRAIDSVTASISNYKYVGLYVDSVSEDSDLYGKLQKGDIITQINGIDVTSDEIVLDIIERAKAGDKVKVTFVSSKETSKTIEAVLKANVGESSYTQIETNESSRPNFSGGENGGAFDFPFGE